MYKIHLFVRFSQSLSELHFLYFERSWAPSHIYILIRVLPMRKGVVDIIQPFSNLNQLLHRSRIPSQPSASLDSLQQ